LRDERRKDAVTEALDDAWSMLKGLFAWALDVKKPPAETKLIDKNSAMVLTFMGLSFLRVTEILLLEMERPPAP
jgi:hypothetical protein